MANIEYLSHRSNINVYRFPESLKYGQYDRKIVIYDDHRVILNVMYVALLEGLFFNQLPSVISFDRHDDAVRLTSKTKQKIKTLRKSSLTLQDDMKKKKMWSFTEFGLSPMDDDWVRAGMELGLINHYVGFGHNSKDAANIESGYEQYKTLDGNVHHLYSNGHLDRELGSRGVIGDDYYKNSSKHCDILTDLQFHNGLFDNDPLMPFVFDVDLDCFTVDIDDHTMAWPEDIFIEHYQKNQAVSLFINKLIARSSMITICREPECCGGIGESNRILELLDCYWFDGALKTQRIR